MIYLVCHSGFLNFGDELIASTWINFLTKKYPGEKIYVDTCMPGVASLLHSSSGNLIFTDTVWRLASSCLGRDIDFILSAGFLRDAEPSVEFGIEQLKRADIVHLVGGGYVTDYHYPNYAILRLLSILKKETNFKLFATGLGIEPLSRENRTILRAIFQDFDAIDFRDKESYEAINSGSTNPNITMSVDDAFLGAFESSEGSLLEERGGKLVIIAQQDEVRDLVLPFLLNLIQSCPFASNGVIMPVLDKGADLALAKQVRGLSGASVEIVDHIDLFRRGLPIGCADFVFTTRFHGHLMASVSGAHGICASVRLPYYDIKHRSLVDLGSGFDLIGMHDFPFEDYDWQKKSSSFEDKREEILESKMKIVDKLYT